MLPRFPGHPVDFACSQTLRHDNRWWSTSRSLESRPLRSSTSRLFMDRDEEKPRAIRERWSAESVFINSALENFPAGAEDRSTSGWEEARRIGPTSKNRGTKRHGPSDGEESSTCSKSRPDAHANLYGSPPPNEKEPVICAARERLPQTE